MGALALRSRLLICLLIMMVTSVHALGQGCTHSTQTDICLKLVPNSNVLPSLPSSIQVRNREQVTFHLTNVSPLEQCKLTGTSVTPAPPASALQNAVTSIMGMAPFGVGTLLTEVPSPETTTKAISRGSQQFSEYLRTAPAKEVNADPIVEALKKQQEVIDKGKKLVGLQMGKQQDGVAIASMYSTFLISDYRTGGTFLPAFTALSKALSENLNYLPPGEQAADGTAASRRVTPAKSGGLLTDEVPGADPNATGLFIVDLQSELDETKSLITTAHSIYDKDPKKLASLVDTYATLDRYQSVGSQLLAVLTANDTALKTQQTSLMSLKLSLDQLQRSAFYAPDKPKETADLPVSRYKDGTETGNITCVNRLDNSKVTLDPMPYSVEFHLVPLLAFSSGVLFSPIEKETFGTNTVVDTSQAAPTPPTPVPTLNTVAVTDSASKQVVPFSFLSLRLGPGWSYREAADSWLYSKCRKCGRFLSRHVFAGGLTGGFGVNPNGGTTSPEYFLGLFGSVDRFMLHFGWDRGRVQTLSGHFKLGDIVPPQTTIPTDHHFVGKASAAISVRLYP